MKKITLAFLLSLNTFAFNYQTGDICGFLQYQKVRDIGMAYTMTLNDDDRLFYFDSNSSSVREISRILSSIIMNHDWDQQEAGPMVCVIDMVATETAGKNWAIEYLEDIEDLGLVRFAD